MTLRLLLREVKTKIQIPLNVITSLDLTRISLDFVLKTKKSSNTKLRYIMGFNPILLETV